MQTPQSNISDLADKVFVKMIDKDPRAPKQAEMLFGAFQNYMKKDIQMTPKQVNDKFIKMTGAVGDKRNVQASAVVGRFGEVVVNEAIQTYFEIEAIRKRYGYHIIEGSASILIPADANKASQSQQYIEEALKPLEQKIQEEAFKQWKKEFPDSDTMPDFFMANAVPLEVKAKINSYVFLSEGNSMRHAPSNRSRFEAKNPHIGKIANKGGTLLVGGVWVDTIWEDITSEVKPIVDFENTTISALRSLETKLGQDMGNITVKFDNTLPKKAATKHSKDKLFQMITLRLNAFIPMVANKKDLLGIMERKYIRRSDMGALRASSEYTEDVLKAIIDNYEVARK